MARRFVDADFRNLKRSDLVTLVEGQVAKWPTSKGKFLRHKTNIPDMKWALINSEFTTELPLPTAAAPSVPQNQAPIPLPPIEPASIALPPTVQQENGPSSEVLWNAEAQGSSVYTYRFAEPYSLPSFKVQVQENLVRAQFKVTFTHAKFSIERRSILLLIEDARSLFKDKISKRITVPVVNRENCKAGEWRARPRDVMNALQDSISFLDGPAKIGIAEEEAPEYTMFFGTIVERAYCDDPDLDSHLLLIPCDNKLNITATFIGGPKLPFPSEIRPSAEPVAKLEESSSSQTTPKRKREPLTEDEVTFLKKTAKVLDTEAFDTFQKNHNQRLSNAERVKYWIFASNFCKATLKKFWPVGIERSERGSTVKKDALELILNMRRTALDQAISMGNILDKYYGASPRAAEVVKHIEGGELESDAAGSGALAKFLIEYEKDHPTDLDPQSTTHPHPSNPHIYLSSRRVITIQTRSRKQLAGTLLNHNLATWAQRKNILWVPGHKRLRIHRQRVLSPIGRVPTHYCFHSPGLLELAGRARFTRLCKSNHRLGIEDRNRRVTRLDGHCLGIDVLFGLDSSGSSLFAPPALEDLVILDRAKSTACRKVESPVQAATSNQKGFRKDIHALLKTIAPPRLMKLVVQFVCDKKDVKRRTECTERMEQVRDKQYH
ncbi:hypothetical protein DFH06DRAFT_1124361 [Mycena polygramma]|nr:hypothetical protein DFH06DRAFT_1124361 [Mycena polygramma]